MDRDKRWNRVKQKAYDLLVDAKGKQSNDMVKAMEESYADGVTDEFIKPINNASVDGTIQEGDVVIFINFRNDRAKELTSVLTQQDMPEEGMKTIPNLQYYCMTPYDASFKGVHILFPKENVQDTLGEYLSKQGKKQLHTAETEKYAHVTFFFNGGRSWLRSTRKTAYWFRLQGCHLRPETGDERLRSKGKAGRCHRYTGV